MKAVAFVPQYSKKNGPINPAMENSAAHMVQGNLTGFEAETQIGGAGSGLHRHPSKRQWCLNT